MNCPSCNATLYRPSWQSWDDGDTERRYLCRCGYNGQTVEVWKPEFERLQFKADMFQLLCEANGSRERAREILEETA